MTFGVRRAALAGLLAIALAGCGGKGGHERAMPGADTARAPTPTGAAAPPQPAGPQVGQSDPVLDAAAPRLREWVAMWRATLPGFEPDSLWGEGVTRWRLEGWEAYERAKPTGHEADDDDNATAAILTLRSPDGAYDLDIDRYQYLGAPRGEFVIGGEPDSAPMLIDLAGHRALAFEFCGTPCGFHWATWLDARRFALAGWHEAGDDAQWMQGRISIYSLRDSTVRSYVTRVVPARAYRRYELAWERWVEKRYRAWMEMRHRPRPRA